MTWHTLQFQERKKKKTKTSLLGSEILPPILCKFKVGFCDDAGVWCFRVFVCLSVFLHNPKKQKFLLLKIILGFSTSSACLATDTQMSSLQPLYCWKLHLEWLQLKAVEVFNSSFFVTPRICFATQACNSRFLHRLRGAHGMDAHQWLVLSMFLGSSVVTTLRLLQKVSAELGDEGWRRNQKFRE